MTILGLGGLLNDAACAILRDGKLVAAVEEAKVARRFTPGALPHAAMRTALALAQVSPEEIDCVSVARPIARGPEIGRAHV